jgi:hypothetical protein
MRLWDAYFFQQLDGSLPGRRFRHAHVRRENLADLETYGEHRIEGAHRLLEDHRDALPAQGSHFGL